jgi:hypothetical protein
MIAGSSIQEFSRPLVIAMLVLASIQADLAVNSGCSMTVPVAIIGLIVLTALGAFSNKQFRKRDTVWAGLSAGFGFAAFIALKRFVATSCIGESFRDSLPGTIVIASIIGVIAGLAGSFFCWRQRKRSS